MQLLKRANPHVGFRELRFGRKDRAQVVFTDHHRDAAAAISPSAVAVRRLPPGEAAGSHDLRRHGLAIDYDPTCWPRRYGWSVQHAARAPRIEAGYIKLLAAVFVPELDADFRPQGNHQDAQTWAWIRRWSIRMFR